MDAAVARRNQPDRCRSRPRVADLFAKAGVVFVVLAAAPVEAQITTHSQQTSFAVPACGRDGISPAVCQKEFDHWQTQEAQWRENRRKFANHASLNGKPVRRVTRPDPPVWVVRYCADPLLNNASASAVCSAYDDYLRYDWTLHVEGPRRTVTTTRRVFQSSPAEGGGFLDYLLKNVHYDGPWTNSENGPRIYGLGTHMTLAHAGRVHLWGPPGLLVLRQPDGRIEVKMTWGVDIFVADVPMPWATEYRLPLYFSIAKVFGNAEQASTHGAVNSGLNMIGVSMTLRR